MNDAQAMHRLAGLHIPQTPPELSQPPGGAVLAALKFLRDSAAKDV